jgi:UDP-N-acetylglucosamine 1-carboxyvinyltransferase
MKKSKEVFIVEGGNPLRGVILLGGAKNSGFKLMITSLLMQGESTLLNITPIGDVQVVKKIIRSLGGKVTKHGDRSYYIDSTNINSYRIPNRFGEKSRASLLFAGPLLSRFKKAVIPLPGGDHIGSSRDLDRHFDGLKAFGVNIEMKGEIVSLSTKGLKGAHYRFKKPSHTATENLLMTAVLAEGKTVLENVALEPEVDDMIMFLNKAGAKIERKPDRVIEITGVKKLKPVIHKVIPDRNQVVTYAIAAVLTKGDIIIEDANKDHLKTFLDKFAEAGGGYETGEFGIRFFYKQPIKATNVETAPHPGFMTDWQPLWATFMTQAIGESTVVETIYDNRFQYVPILIDAGADIIPFDLNPKNPDNVYSFNIKEDIKYDKQGIKIKGKTVFKPINIDVYDVRFGATLLLVALVANGKSELREIHHIDRGYYDIDKNLILLGAKIKRVKRPV